MERFFVHGCDRAERGTALHDPSMGASSAVGATERASVLQKFSLCTSLSPFLCFLRMLFVLSNKAISPYKIMPIFTKNLRRASLPPASRLSARLLIGLAFGSALRSYFGHNVLNFRIRPKISQKLRKNLNRDLAISLHDERREILNILNGFKSVCHFSPSLTALVLI